MSRRISHEISVLLAGGAVYCVACCYAISRDNSFPPDPIWKGLRFLWIVPVLLALNVGQTPTKGRFFWLVAYSFITGVFNTLLLPTVVPVRQSLVETCVIAIAVIGPMHLIATVVASLMFQSALSRWSGWGQSRISLLAIRRCLFIGILAIAAVSLIAIREYSLRKVRQIAYESATADWKQGKASVYSEDIQMVQSEELDPETGLPYRPCRRANAFTDAYNSCIRKLYLESR